MSATKSAPLPPIVETLSKERQKSFLQATLEERYEKNAVLFRQGDEADYFWIVLEGWVHLVRSPSAHDHARAVVLFTITPREALCGISALGTGRYNMSAVAGTACRVLRIPAETFNAALAAEPAFAYHALRLCARRIQKIAEQYGSMAEPVLQRIIRTLLRLQEQFGDTLPVTHRELAQMSWTTTESAIRTVRALKLRRCLTGRRGKLTITRAERLEQFLHHDG